MLKIHLICRGNAFRSIIAEAYIKSLHLKNVSVESSGTEASKYYDSNIHNFELTLGLLREHGLEKYAKDHFGDELTPKRMLGTDVAVCMNQRACNEARDICDLPSQVIVWDITDIGEPGRVAHDAAERKQLMEDVYADIVKSVDSLVEQLHLLP